MTIPEGEDQRKLVDFTAVTWLPEDEQARLHERAGSDAVVEWSRRGWLRKVLNIPDPEDTRSPKNQFNSLCLRDTPMIVEHVSEIGAAIDHELTPDTALRFGLYLLNETDVLISGGFDDMSPHDVGMERRDFIRLLQGQGDYRLTPRQALRLHETRRHVIGEILGSATMAEIFGINEDRLVLGGDKVSSRLPEVYPAGEILEKIEDSLAYRSRLIPPGLGILSKHFMNTERAVPPQLYPELRSGLRALAIKADQEIRKDRTGGPGETYDPDLLAAIEFWQGFMRTRAGELPQSRAEYMARLKGKMHLDEEHTDAKIADDNAKLSLALSWLAEKIRR